jgi:hypothetical protein
MRASKLARWTARALILGALAAGVVVGVSGVASTNDSEWGAPVSTSAVPR